MRAFSSCLILVGCLLAGSVPGSAQAISRGVTYLTGSQQADGSWESTEVRRVHATSEALRALQEVAQAPGNRSSAAGFLEAEPVEDSDDRARRLTALAAEGRNVAGLVTVLLSDADPEGGWGLTLGFVADPLDTALALSAVTAQPAADEDLLRMALISLLAAQKPDGGWPCVQTKDGDADSEIFCTSQALLALTAYHSRFYLDPQIDAATDFLRVKRNPNGSYGAPGNEVINTALAAMALASVPAFGNEVAVVISFLNGSQRSDGSWEGDPYTTALALQALKALSLVPYCGDGAMNQPGEACDGGVPAGLTCEGVGLGAGTLACSAQCTLDTTGCSAPPACGDNVRNQLFEVCDGTDLAAQSCETQGFATGTLACSNDCLTFDVSSCNAAATCGDGEINQPNESCDLSDFNGATCESLGLGGGQLSCSSDCNMDTSQCDAASFIIDNKGREFFVGLMPNPLGSATASVQLTSDVPTTVTIQYPINSPSFSQTVALTPGQVKVVNLPNGSHTGWPAGVVRNNAARVFGPDEFVTYLVNRAQFTSDAGMALPVDALGTSYILTTYPSRLVSQDRSQFLVVAPYDNTTVTITPTSTLRIPPPGVNVPANTPYQVTLGRGQGFRGEAAFFTNDLTGTLIESDRPVAVLNGNICTNVPAFTSYCDHIFEVAHPLQSWGTSALVRNLPNRNGGSIYRVVASVDGTQVSLDGVLQATLNKGKFMEVGPITGSHAFTANHPIFVTQFMTGSASPGASLGDPSMANMIPPDQYLKSYTFSTVGGSQFVQHFLTLIAPTASVGTVTLDGVPVATAQFAPIGSTGFSSALLQVSEGSHTTSSPQPHGITVEGINADDSYIYPGGAQLEFINQFCGDGSANREAEACDGNDFRGSTCSSFGYASGFLQCTADCRVDLSQCAGFTVEDEDEDGFPATEDCNDNNPEVNPGMPEIPGNGIDDDCNPATPDTIPVAALSCEIFPDRLSYGVADLVSLASAVKNDHASFSISGVSASLRVRNAGGDSIYDESRQLAPLPPGARSQQSFVLSAGGHEAGSYQASLTVSTAGQTLATCSASFTIDASAGLAGTLVLDPEKVDAGDSSNATYTVHNRGNVSLNDLEIRVVLVDPASGAVVAELLDGASLAPGQSFTDAQAFSSQGLETNKAYMAVLLAKPSGADSEQTLDSATLTVVNAPPVCAAAFASSLGIWPPNHKLVPVTVGGVTDPDGDPVTLTVQNVFQDERTDHTGDGKTCPDALGVGTSSVKVRAERSGQLDGRVYHLFFKAEDGRGAKCEGVVTVCVPHNNKGACVDQGALFDSTVCD